MSSVYHAALCTPCLGLVGAPCATLAHSRLGRPRSEVGYQLYRCALCHAQWSLTPKGWVAGSP